MSEDKCKSTELPARAERNLNHREEYFPNLSTKDSEFLIYQLRAHQIVLELQNEDLRKAQIKLTESRDSFSNLYEFAPVGFLTISEKGLIVRANMTIVEMLGKSRQLLITSRVSKYIFDDDQNIYCSFRSNLLKSEERQSCELRIHRAGAEPFWAQLDGINLKRAESKNFELQLTITDINKRRLAEEKLKMIYDELDRRVEVRTAQLTQANRKLKREIEDRESAEEKTRQRQLELEHVSRVATMGEMTTGLAHELNQPLAAITMYSEASLHSLSATTANPVNQVKVFEKIRVQSLRAGAIIHRIKKLTKPYATRYEATQINDSIDDVLTLLQSELKDKNINVSLKVKNLPLVRGDSVQISQVLLNLISNAVEAINSANSEHRQITLQASIVEEDKLKVTIQDSGGGLNKDKLSKAFEAFYTTKPQGMGMGLSICRTIIESHGGHIGATNNEECGTSFHFTLPISDLESAPNSATEKLQTLDSEITTQPRHQVFIVDDDPAIRDSLKIVLENLHYQTEFYSSAMEFLNTFDRSKLGCLILDASMPEMSGIDLLAKLEEENIKLPVIMITGHAELELQVELKKGRIIEVHRKPFQTKDLLASIQLACSKIA
ncbi:MAG: ATP-binding protein [Gimesia sp.]